MSPEHSSSSSSSSSSHDLLCFSHLRWGEAYQRPQQLMTRLAQHYRVFFIEEPIFVPEASHLDAQRMATGLSVVVPHLDASMARDAALTALTQQHLLEDLCARETACPPILWYYTPAAVSWSTTLPCRMVAYDCMGEAGVIDRAGPEQDARERQLMRRAQLVLMSGRSLYEARRHLHSNIQLLPNSVDTAHFARALEVGAEPAAQRHIPGPRVGYAGTLDARVDVDLLGAVAALRPHLQFVLLGPIEAAVASRLPQAPNLHYLGPQPYHAVPDYMRGWDVAMLPLARNAATRFISPKQAPESLAAGRPVVSTSIRDVVRPYGQIGLVRIADEPASFAKAIDLARTTDLAKHRAAAAVCLASTSWDQTALRIGLLLENLGRNRVARSQRIGRSVLG